ncbi:unnamed protein product [Fusarium venenatum]|uniref:Uncharacterized protein n=1 Tax=Fusarium venenatum TaxID=56646 RepID=A0A2L2SXA0_9HYPO|nr:uncharacterized protein FVRRES_13346 [Fusarium venenatum]CEI40938.1 unnamed protein product [Fusarium venenatum]
MHADDDMMLDIAPIVGVESIFVLLLNAADAAGETLGVRFEYTHLLSRVHNCSLFVRYQT